MKFILLTIEQELDSYPASPDILDRAEVVYHEMPGWQTPTTNVKAYGDLPKAARDYIEVSIIIYASKTDSGAKQQQFIENVVGVKVGGRAR